MEIYIIKINNPNMRIKILQGIRYINCEKK